MTSSLHRTRRLALRRSSFRLLWPSGCRRVLYDFVTDRARDWLLSEAAEWVRFEPARRGSG